jgi:hypothetical protein
VSAPGAASGNNRPKKRGWFLAVGGGSLSISILLHVLFGVSATYLIVEHFQKKHINFHATEPPAQHTEVEHKVELAKRNNVESAPPDIKRIVTTDVSAIALPEPPEVSTTDEAAPTAMAGVEGVMGSGLGSGRGKGGNGGGGGIPLFGAPDGTGLQGYLYDLKQTPDKQPTGMNRQRYYAALTDYLRQGWNESLLERYYKSQDPLYANFLAISTRRSEEAPKAFALENEVQPDLWVIHYHAKVKAPQSGDYRFAGFADNVLEVRIKGQTVLDAGWDSLSNDANLRQELPFVFPTYVPWATNKTDRPGQPGFDRTDVPPETKVWSAHLKIGPVFHLETSETVDMDVLVGDDGGVCSFFLLIEKEGEIYGNGAGGFIAYPFFQIGAKGGAEFSPGEEHPPYSSNSYPWQEAGR